MPDPTSLPQEQAAITNAFSVKDPAKGVFNIMHTKEGCG